MITGVAKGKVDAIWQKTWEGGITNPLEVISQLTYLMFTRSLDEKELETERTEQALGTTLDHIFPETYKNAYGATVPGAELRWSRFKDKPAQEMCRIVSEFVFPFLKELKVERYLRDYGDSLVIQRLHRNLPMTEAEFEELEWVFTCELGSADDYERAYGDTPFGLLVRRLVKLDHDAAMGPSPSLQLGGLH